MQVLIDRRIPEETSLEYLARAQGLADDDRVFGFLLFLNFVQHISPWLRFAHAAGNASIFWNGRWYCCCYCNSVACYRKAGTKEGLRSGVIPLESRRFISPFLLSDEDGS